MVSRRKFLGMLAALPAITALAGSALRLPPRKDVEVHVSPYFASQDAWYIKTDDEAGFKHFYNSLCDNEVCTVHPRILMVPPRHAMSARYVLTHKPTLLERFMWRLFPVD